MKIWGTIQQIAGVNKVDIVRKNKQTKEIASQKDQLTVSNIARDMAVARAALQKVDDVRSDKIETLQQQIKSGTYNINAQEAANTIVDRIFDKKL